MKKYIAIFLTLMLAAGMIAGCGKNPADLSSGAGNPSSNAADSENSKAEDPSSQTEKTEFARGEWKDNVYSSQFLGISFTLPAEWAYATDEEIAEMMNLGADLLGNDKEYLAEIAKVKTVYDMMAQDPATGTNVIVMFENLALSVGGTKLSEEEYAEILKEQLTAVDTLEYTIGEIAKKQLGGHEFTVLSTTVESAGLQQEYYLLKEGKYMACVLLSGATDGIEQVLGQFSSLK